MRRRSSLLPLAFGTGAEAAAAIAGLLRVQVDVPLAKDSKDSKQQKMSVSVPRRYYAPGQ